MVDIEVSGAGDLRGAWTERCRIRRMLWPKEWSVASLLDEMMRRDGYRGPDIRPAKMWCDTNRSGPRGACEYVGGRGYTSAVSQNEPVTQASVARKYEVSVSTLSQSTPDNEEPGGGG